MSSTAPPTTKVTTASKKPKSASIKKASLPAHPPYFQMIKEALLALHERSGSSSYAIAKYLEEKHKSVLPANFKKILGTQLKNNTANGKLIKIKASFKLSESGKKETTEKKKPQKAVKKADGAKKKADGAKKKTGAAKKKVDGTKKSAKKVDVGKKVVKAAKKVAVQKTKKATPVKAKKAAPAKPKAKQPKSIKSPAAKKARKA